MSLDLKKFILMADISKYNEAVDFDELLNGKIEIVGIRINEDED
jgi:hypothetical protein